MLNVFNSHCVGEILMIKGKKSPVKRAPAQTPAAQPAETSVQEPRQAVEPIPAAEESKKTAVKVKKAASPVKKAKKVTCPPRVEFIGANNTRYLIVFKNFF